MKIAVSRFLVFCLLILLSHPAQAARKEGDQPLHQVTQLIYLAPNVIQKSEADVFTSFAVTNTTPYWFNVRIYLISAEGEIVQERTPLLKGYGTWQQSSGDLTEEDFQGSIWMISPYPLIAVSMNYQLLQDGKLTHLATVRLEKLDSDEEASLRHSSAGE